MRTKEYPQFLRNNGFKKKTFRDRSGSWYEKKISINGVGYVIEVDMDWKTISISLYHKVKNGALLVDVLKTWKLNRKNVIKVLNEWDNSYIQW